MVMHTEHDASQIEVCPKLHVSTEKDNVEWLLETGAEPMKFFIGYAGWSPGQLEAEMETGAWLTAPASAEHIFKPNDRLWAELLRSVDPTLTALGLNPKIVPDDPSMN